MSPEATEKRQAADTLLVEYFGKEGAAKAWRDCRILQPGKFEGEPPETLYWYDLIMDGAAEETTYESCTDCEHADTEVCETCEPTGLTDWFKLDDSDREAFGIPASMLWAMCWESIPGFFNMGYSVTGPEE
jgi:hypothetical protein